MADVIERVLSDAERDMLETLYRAAQRAQAAYQAGLLAVEPRLRDPDSGVSLDLATGIIRQRVPELEGGAK